jgi:hypothetical protein
METNPAARLHAQMLRRTIKDNENPVELRTGGFLKRPIESSSINSNEVAERAAHYFMQVYNERKKFNEDKNA